jgi:hypothetical protein
VGCILKQIQNLYMDSYVLNMLYAVLCMFVAILLGSFSVSYVLTIYQGTYVTNSIIVFLVCVCMWLFFDNMSILDDVKNKVELRKSLVTEYRLLDLLRIERHEMYRDLRQIEALKYKEIRRNAMLSTKSCTF